MNLKQEWWVKRRPIQAPEPFRARYGSLLGELLWARGIDEADKADDFLNPRLDQLHSPFSILNLSGAAERVAKAIRDSELIAIYADYDMDGMSGLALLLKFFEACGSTNVIPYQPDRLNEGYGVHPAAMDELARKGVKVIITVDTGTTALEAALQAKELGIDFVVTDHHQQKEQLPATPYLVNPNQTADTSKMGYLSGAGVAFYFAIAVRTLLRNSGHFKKMPEPDLRQYLDYYVLGTVADHVDLIGDNRILVRNGLKQLLQTSRPGLKALLKRVIPDAKHLSTRDISFSITPKLNAASRMGQAHLSTELLITSDPKRADELIELVMSLNDKRSQVQNQVFEEAVEQAILQCAQDHPVIVVNGEWHEGVLGVVAAKLVDKFKKPSIVLTKIKENNMLRGSMRTLNPFNCISALDSCSDFLHKYGGHAMAAGLQLKSDSLKDFSERLLEGSTRFFDSITEKFMVNFDGDLPDNLKLEEVESLDAASPWGMGNPEPLFRLKDVDVGDVQVVKGRHLKCQISNGLDVIGFFKSEDLAKLKQSGARRFDALVTPEINRFRNQKNIQLRLQYVRPSEAPDISS